MQTDIPPPSWPEVKIAASVHNVTVPPGVVVGQTFAHGLSEALGCELDNFAEDEDNRMRMYGFGGDIGEDDSIRGSVMAEDDRFSSWVPESAGSRVAAHSVRCQCRKLFS